MDWKILFFFMFSATIVMVDSHLMPNFLFHLTDSAGNRPFPPIYPDKDMKLYFNFIDMYNNFRQARANNFLLFHNRYIHLLIASEDYELVMHTHPDDFGNITAMESSNGCFWINIRFPRSGYWLITASFLFTNGTYIREGVAETSFYVYPTNTSVEMNSTATVWNYTPENYFRTYQFKQNDVYTNYIDSRSNIQPGGVYASMEFGTSEISHHNMNMKRQANTLKPLQNITTAECIPFTIRVRVMENGNYVPATLVPYLAAPVHFTMVSDQNFVYHAHGSYLLPNMTIDEARMMLMNDSSMNHGNMTDGDDSMAFVHHALMMGLTANGSINCFVEAGQLIRDTGMDMGLWHGPATFGPDIMGIFDFPITGNFRVWANMKIRLANGTEFLFTPHFDVLVTPPQAPGLTTGMDMGTGMSEMTSSGMTQTTMTDMTDITSTTHNQHTTEAVSNANTFYGFAMIGFVAFCLLLSIKV